MARREPAVITFINLFGRLPWWVSLALALVCYVLLSAIASSDASQTLAGKPMGEVMMRQVILALAMIGQYVLPMLLAVGAVANLGRKFKRGRLFHWASVGDQARAMSQMGWQEFELLIGEAFRRQGYTVRETGQNGNDGGIDLILEKDGAVSVVQCKHWKAFRVGVDVVRAHLGVMINDEADYGIIVTSGQFTREARAFARRHNIELIDGRGLKSLLRPAINKKYLGNTAHRIFDSLYVNGKNVLLWKFSMAIMALIISLALIGGGFWVFVDQMGIFSEKLMARAKTTERSATPELKTKETSFRETTISNDAEHVQEKSAQTQASVEPVQRMWDSAAYRAFEDQHKEPEDCRVWRDDQHMVECANRYIRARNEFITQYESSANNR